MKRTLFCSNVNKLLFIEGSKRCSVENCRCDETIVIDDLFELYAHLYSLMDGNNIISYLDYYKRDPDFRNSDKAIFEMESKKWGEHIEVHPYDTIYSTKIDNELIPLLKSQFEDVTHAKQFLIYTFAWIRIIDNHVGKLIDKNKQRRLDKFPIETKKGLLLINRRGGISAYVQEKTKKYLTDPNYYSLRKQIDSVFLIPYKDLTYEVNYLRLSLDKWRKWVEFLENVGELKVAFVPGNITSFQEYSWVIEDGGADRKLFTINGVKSKMHNENIVKQLDLALENSSNIIIFPELSVSLEMQKTIIEKAKLSEEMPLVFPGSFHETSTKIFKDFEDEYCNYNYSLIHFGDNPTSIFKMNKFEFPPSNKFVDELLDFQNSTGIENISCLKRTLTLVDTPFGLLAILICIDYLIPEIQEILVNYNVSIVVVMSLTGNPSGSHFYEAMSRLGKINSTTTLLCNNPAGLYLGNHTETVVAYFPRRGKLFTSDQHVVIEKIENMIK